MLKASSSQFIKNYSVPPSKKNNRWVARRTGSRPILCEQRSRFPIKGRPLTDSSPDAPWKDGREQSDRWKETPRKGFLPRVSDRTHRPISRLTSFLEFFEQLEIAVGHVGLLAVDIDFFDVRPGFQDISVGQDDIGHLAFF